MIEPVFTEHEFLTPNGNPVRFRIRTDTNDWNTAYSVTGADEYELRGITNLEGWALDLGGYAGHVAICLAVDNPGLEKVVVVEPVPLNVDLIREHAEMNGVFGRVEVHPGAVGPAGAKTEIRFGFEGDVGLEHHAWVGNTSLVYELPPAEKHESVIVSCVDLLELKAYAFAGAAPAFVKVDCEGGEWDALDQLVGLGSPRLIGEWHPVLGRTSGDELVEAFERAGYQVKLDGPAQGPALFTATR